ncbi:hypothetical protein C8Q80DRAFT_1156638 [Daedaleopsis nitida]|nr:hypothetical protein C8Q80DRAFT_1156638 [Daedaleopsis nitida]
MANDDLLRLLEAHGQQFLQSFETSAVTGKRKETSGQDSERSIKKKRTQADPGREEEEEWMGFGQSADSDDEEDGSGPSEDGESNDEPDGEDEDDDFTYGNHTAKQTKEPAVVVFTEAGSSSVITKGSKSGFMSSKVTKLTQETAKPSKKKTSSEDEDDDMTNAQNDALLHRLVHTKLLSGSLNPDLDLKPAQKKKALAGRVMEAAGKVKLGKGEAAVRQAEHNRAAKHVRDGLLEKKKERQQKELEEAKHLGNYHPTLKTLYDASSSKTDYRKRDRGLKMGVGSFKGGILRLGKSEISAVEGRSGSGRGRGGRKRGGKR